MKRFILLAVGAVVLGLGASAGKPDSGAVRPMPNISDSTMSLFLEAPAPEVERVMRMVQPDGGFVGYQIHMRDAGTISIFQ